MYDRNMCTIGKEIHDVNILYYKNSIIGSAFFSLQVHIPANWLKVRVCTSGLVYVPTLRLRLTAGVLADMFSGRKALGICNENIYTRRTTISEESYKA